MACRRIRRASASDLFGFQAMDAPKKFSTRQFWRVMVAAARELDVSQDVGVRRASIRSHFLFSVIV